MTVEAVLLGVAQDGGVPQAGCHCPRCARALQDPLQAYRVVCLGIIDHRARKFWLIDATPNLPTQLGQLASIAPDCTFAGICLTHAHMGHYSGLIHLGPEAYNASRLPLLCSPRMASFLRQNQPWTGLIEKGHVHLQIMEVGKPLQVSEHFVIRPIAVPHRDEFSDTLAFLIEGPDRSLFYCPDIDSWTRWDQGLNQFFQGIDIALLDGTFYDRDEVPGRDLNLIPHPFVIDYPMIFSGLETEIFLIHLNHTNPLFDQSPQNAELQSHGLRLGAEGQRWVL